MKRARVWNVLGVLSLALLGVVTFARRRGLRAGSEPMPLPPHEGGGALRAAGTASTGGLDHRPAGRHAQTPGEIPGRGWWQIAKRVFNDISEDRILAEAAGVTFYVLLAIFPALTALVSLYGLIADPKTIGNDLSAASGVMPGGGMQILHDQVKSLTSGPAKGLGIGFVVGLLASLWSANAGMKALFDSLNVVYEEKEKRSFIRRTLLTFVFTLCALVFLIVAMSGVVVLPAVLNFIGLGQTANTLLKLARWPALIVILTVFLAAVFRYGPSRQKARWRWVSWGGVAAALGWLVVSLAFSYYVEHFGSYNKTYGSLGAAIGFMTWIWLSTSVVLIGAEMDAEMEHQTARDTTEGPDRPLGARQAVKADHVAATA